MLDVTAQSNDELVPPAPFQSWKLEPDTADQSALIKDPFQTRKRVTERPKARPQDGDTSVGLNDIRIDDLWRPAAIETDVRDVVDLPRLLARAEEMFVERIRANLEDDREHAIDDGEMPPNEAAVGTCLLLARRIAPCLALSPGLKWTAFTEDSGDVSLVLQSLNTNRRLSFHIPSDGVGISALRIDEQMRSESFLVSLDEVGALREKAEWVTKAA